MIREMIARVDRQAVEERVYGRSAGRNPAPYSDWVAASWQGDESLIHFQFDHERNPAFDMNCTFLTIRSKSTRVVSNSSHPAASAFSRAPDIACAVSAMIGIALVAGLAFSRRVASHPSTTGRSRSTMMISG